MRTLSLLTLNCFGAPGIRTNARLRQLARKLNDAAYSMVCLQEVQTHRYRALLTNACRAVYPEQAYQHFLHAPKGGLLTLSRHKIVEQKFVLFRNRGLWYTPAVADWILHKGMLITQIQISGLPVIVINTHLTANYTGDWRYGNMFARQEHREILQIAETVNDQPLDALVIVCGDFNIPRGNWMYDMLLQQTGLIDPLHGDETPTFRPHRGMGSRYAMPIDFTFYRPPDTLEMTAKNRLCFHDSETVDGHKLHVSDHLGVHLSLVWEPIAEAETQR